MSVSSLPIERRTRRSELTLEALTYQLEHIYERESLHNFTLADERGLVVAQAGNPHESEVIAAYTPVLAESVDERSRRQVLSGLNTIAPTLTPDSIHIREFTVDDSRLFLTLVGRPGVYRDVGLYRAITGVRRILNE